MAQLKHSFTRKVNLRLLVGRAAAPDNQVMLDQQEDHEGFRIRLQLAMDEEGISNTQLADATGVTVQAVGGWLKTGKVSRSRVPAIAKTVRRSADWLLTGKELPNLREVPATLPRKIPIINYIQAGHPKEVVDDYMAGAGMGEVSLYGEAAERYSRYTFALEVDGDSMLPEFRPGDVVIVDPDVAPNPGNIVVAKLDTEDRATLKKYRARGFDAQGEPIFELVPLNDDYPTITVNAGNPGRVVGTVVEHHRKLR